MKDYVLRQSVTKRGKSSKAQILFLLKDYEQPLCTKDVELLRHTRFLLLERMLGTLG